MARSRLRGARRMVSRHNQAARHVPRPLRRPARRHGVHHRLRAAVPQRSHQHPHPNHQRACLRFEQYINVLPVHRGPGSARVPAPGPVSPAPRPFARRRLLRRLRRQHPGRRLRHRRDALRADLLRHRPRARGVFEVSQVVWGIFLVLNTAATYGIARVRARFSWSAGGAPASGSSGF